MVQDKNARRRNVLCGSAACLAVAGGWTGSAVHAATITTTTADAAAIGPDGSPEDGDTLTVGTTAGTTNVANSGLTTARAGSNTGTQPGKAYVIPFVLPTLTTGTTFTNVSLSIFQNFTSGATIPTAFNADLYALTGYSTTSTTVTGAMYYQGALDTTNATLLQDNFLTPASDAADTSTTADTASTTTAAANTALASYLNTEYAANGAGSVVFLRLSADADSGAGTTAYVFDTADAGTTLVPTITYSTTSVPEPAGLGLVVTALGSLAARSRRTRVPAR